MKRRSDIDGIRAFAVMPVLIAHAWGGSLPGGHLGVDVFFVLSGFLITSICLAERARGGFDLRAFWGRRVRRILPAFLVVVLSVLVLSSFLHIAAFQETVFGTGLSSLLFASNIYLPLFESDYFSQETSLNPLSHMWSLSVEEQFYLVFPFLFLFLSPRHFVWLAVLFFGLSFGFYLSYDSTSPWFHFHPLLRAWQLLAGVLLAMFLFKGRPFLSRLTIPLQIIGVMSLVWAYGFTGKEDYLGGVLAVLGAVCLIASGERSLVGKFLSFRIFVLIGLISYSLYLWHQPVMAFARLWMPDSSMLFLATTVGLSFVLAALTYMCVEKPVLVSSVEKERRTRISVRIMLIWILSVFAFLLFGPIIQKNAQADMEFHVSIGYEAEQWSQVCMLWGEHETLPPFCGVDENGNRFHPEPNQVDVAFWGDSHTGALYSGLVGSPSGFSSVHLGMSGCDIALSEKLARSGNDCIKKHEAAFSFIKGSESLDVLVVGMNWSLPDHRTKFSAEKIDHLVEILKSLDFDGTIFITTPIVWTDVDPFPLGVKARGFGPDMTFSLSGRDDLYRSFAEFEHKLDSAGVEYEVFDVRDSLCREERCYGMKDGVPLYYDRSHLSVPGSRLVLKDLIPIIQQYAQ